MLTEDRFNQLIDSAIKDLSSDNLCDGVESLVELAQIFAAAGMPQHTFEDIRQHIVKEATILTDAPFILEKLKLAEREHARLSNQDLTITNLVTR
jgi:hypothetical protein